MASNKKNIKFLEKEIKRLQEINEKELLNIKVRKLAIRNHKKNITIFKR